MTWAKQTPSFPLLCLSGCGKKTLSSYTLWPVKHRKLCLLLSNWWWQILAGHLINHTCQWSPGLRPDCFCLFVFLVCLAAARAEFLVRSLKEKRELSKVHWEKGKVLAPLTGPDHTRVPGSHRYLPHGRFVWAAVGCDKGGEMVLAGFIVLF